MINVTVWGENRHEQLEPAVAKRYPNGMHGAIAEGIEANLGEAVTVAPPPSTSPSTA